MYPNVHGVWYSKLVKKIIGWSCTYTDYKNRLSPKLEEGGLCNPSYLLIPDLYTEFDHNSTCRVLNYQ